jgi:cytochrome c oxidase subunit I+III
MKFKWNDNAYASVVWTLLGMHLLHLIVAAGETFILTVWLMTHRLEEKYAVDISVTAVYWYWIVGVWLPIYLIIYWAPRILYTGPRLFF